MKYYISMVIHKDVTAEVFGRKTEIPLVYADGMIGAIPVFETKEAADKFAGDKYRVVEIETYNLSAIDSEDSE